MFKLPNWSMYTYVLEGGCPIHAPKIPCHSDSYVSFPITFSGIFHWAGVYQWFPGNPPMKHALQENRKNKKYEGKKKHRPFRNAQYFCCSWWRKEKNIYEEANKWNRWQYDCTKPFYVYGAAYRINFCDWFFCCELQVHEAFFHKEQLVTIARIQMVRGVCCSVYSHPLWKWMFFHNNSFPVSSKSALNIFAFLPHPKQKCVKFSFLVSLTFKSCQFQL